MDELRFLLFIHHHGRISQLNTKQARNPQKNAQRMIPKIFLGICTGTKAKFNSGLISVRKDDVMKEGPTAVSHITSSFLLSEWCVGTFAQ